jgi:hypothetical protein
VSGKPAKPMHTEELRIEKYMLAGMLEPGETGFVPFCSAVHWIMSNGGQEMCSLADVEVWGQATNVLTAAIATGQVQAVGIPASGGLSEEIPGHYFADVRALTPLEVSFDQQPKILCNIFVDRQHWENGFNDELQTGHTSAWWNRLMVRKSHILGLCPRGASTVKVEQDCYRWLLHTMRSSPTKKTKSKEKFQAEALEKFPTIGNRAFSRAWNSAVRDSGANWSRAGRPGKSNRNIS